ncbi:MAG: NADH-quinone oxidoreductase subunit NuoK [Deltaproteobacteria bacterium]
MLHVELKHYLVLSSILFVLGILSIISRKNSIGVLMGIELVLISASINFVAFSKYIAMDLSGQVFALFLFIISVSEAIVALAIVLRIYQNRASVDMDDVGDLKC